MGPDLFGGETAYRLLCLASASGLGQSNETCTNYGLPTNLFSDLVQWGPVTLTIGIVLGVPIAVWFATYIIHIIGKASARA